MNDRKSTAAGFTLIETIVVLAVIGAILAAMAPLAFTYLQDARRAQAQNDVNQIADAIGRFMKSTGVPPYKNTASAKIPAWQSANSDYTCLTGSQGVAFTSAEDSTSGTSWSSCWTSGANDTIERHLVSNAPGGSGSKAYSTTGRNKWEGPYLPSLEADPWNKPYLVNVKQMDPAASTPKAAWVLSAGPNGRIETAFDQNAATSVTPSGDDIIARVK